MSAYPQPPIITKQVETQPELPLLELSRRKNISDLEFESITFTCRAKTIKEAEEGILFLMRCEDALKEERRVDRGVESEHAS